MLLYCQQVLLDCKWMQDAQQVGCICTNGKIEVLGTKPINNYTLFPSGQFRLMSELALLVYATLLGTQIVNRKPTERCNLELVHRNCFFFLKPRLERCLFFKNERKHLRLQISVPGPHVDYSQPGNTLVGPCRHNISEFRHNS
jgi:hypothetical protein